KRRGKEIIAEFGANSEATLREAEAVNLGTTFQQQSERWLKSVQTRETESNQAENCVNVGELSFLDRRNAALLGQQSHSERLRHCEDGCRAERRSAAILPKVHYQLRANCEDGRSVRSR